MTALNDYSAKISLTETVTMAEMSNFLDHGGAVTTAEISSVTLETMPSDVLIGKRIFYNASDTRMSAEGYLSCSTCHIDGGGDGQVWDFTGRGEGLRNTITLRGRQGVGHGNVHHSGNFDEIHDFENDIRFSFGGSGFLSDEDFIATQDPLGSSKEGLNSDLDALSEYLTSLNNSHIPSSPHRTMSGNLTASAMIGEVIFSQLGCATCHTGSPFTNSTNPIASLENVGTLRSTSGQRLGQSLTGIDTPTLMGLWNTAPYLHDGSAPTLSDVFRVAGGSVIEAEEGLPGNGASLFNTPGRILFETDDSAYGRSYVQMSNSATLTLNQVEGGIGGTGAIEIRYSSSGSSNMQINVNGVIHQLPAPTTGNTPNWRTHRWSTVRLENIVLQPANDNQIIITANWWNFAIDQITISTADDLSTAQPHRQVIALTQVEQDNLMEYLLQLDGSSFNPGVDSDSDGAEDIDDNCPFLANPFQENNDDDTQGDACDLDDDNDGMLDVYENAHEGLDPMNDTDSNGDLDNDGLTNLQESILNTDPNDIDSDGDNIIDSLDSAPSNYSNLCNGPSPVFESVTIASNMTGTCAASEMINVQPTVETNNGGTLQLISPVVGIDRGFTIPAGAVLRIRSVDPTALP